MKKFIGIPALPELLLCLSAAAANAATQAPVSLGSAATFIALAGTTVTVTGGGVITGNIGISPGNAFVAGTPPVSVNGTVYPGGTVAAQARADLTTAFNDAASRQTPVIVAGNIGGQTLTPGLNKSTSSLAISSGNLTLDAQGVSGSSSYSRSHRPSRLPPAFRSSLLVVRMHPTSSGKLAPPPPSAPPLSSMGIYWRPYRSQCSPAQRWMVGRWRRAERLQWIQAARVTSESL